jgi:hypothetical protein
MKDEFVFIKFFPYDLLNWIPNKNGPVLAVFQKFKNNDHHRDDRFCS